jgi:hypothetical protein
MTEEIVSREALILHRLRRWLENQTCRDNRREAISILSLVPLTEPNLIFYTLIRQQRWITRRVVR